MAHVRGLAVFALRNLIDGACTAVGVREGGEAVIGFLRRHFTDHSQRLRAALQQANDRAWRALEVALAGESLLGRLARAEDRAFRQQFRAFLDASAIGVIASDPSFEQRCLRELRTARQAGRLTLEGLDGQTWATQLPRLPGEARLGGGDRGVSECRQARGQAFYPLPGRQIPAPANPGGGRLRRGVSVQAQVHGRRGGGQDTRPRRTGSRS